MTTKRARTLREPSPEMAAAKADQGCIERLWDTFRTAEEQVRHDLTCDGTGITGSGWVDPWQLVHSFAWIDKGNMFEAVGGHLDPDDQPPIDPVERAYLLGRMDEAERIQQFVDQAMNDHPTTPAPAGTTADGGKLLSKFTYTRPRPAGQRAPANRTDRTATNG